MSQISRYVEPTNNAAIPVDDAASDTSNPASNAASPTSEYSEQLMLPIMDPNGRPLIVIAASNHPLQPDPDARAFILPLPSFMRATAFIRSRVASEEVWAAGSDPEADGQDRRRPMLRLKNGDRVFLRRDGLGEPKDDVLMVHMNINGHRTASIAELAHELPPPRLTLRVLDHVYPALQYRPSPSPMPVETPNGKEWPVERVLDFAEVGNDILYFVRWTGYPPHFDSWISEEDAEGLDVLDEWLSA
ncbi:hypothetical protein DFP72DRAFT_1075743 [Ephemerocybe angulata]|uniref:Chromo domain-containing protein n=1 Tax=Ephemerocybe angulata TaxID=980116 RepID=A0A8H6HIR6_9AGAR|nr:hypothetical protein DFP72DRAFT_1075743 [Tulosesus angulatus]